MSTHIALNQRAALVFQDIDITRMDGIRDGYRVESLSPGINLVHGPNGIGKSRMAAALQALIWPKTCSSRAQIYGRVMISDAVWGVDLDVGQVIYQLNGVAAPSPGLTSLSPAHKDRYLLTLQDLLRANNTDFAQEIQTEAAGGYDLGRLRKELNIRSETTSFRPSKPVKPLNEAREKVSKLRLGENALLLQEQSLTQLAAQRDAAEAAAARVHELEAARAYRDACDQLEEATCVQDGFADPIGRILGNEYEQLQVMRQELKREELKRHQCELEIERLQDELSETGFADALPSDAVVSTLRKRLDHLRKQELELQHAEEAINACTARLDLLKSRIDARLTDAQMQMLDASGLKDLAKLTHEWQRAVTTLQVQNDLFEWLGAAAPRDRDRLRRGVELLSRYLRAMNADPHPAAGKKVFLALMTAAALIMFEAVLLGILVNPALAGMALLAAPLIWIAVTSRQPASAGDVEGIRQEYSTLGLRDIGIWSVEEISRALGNLQSEAAAAELEHERETRWSNLDEKRRKASDYLKCVDEKREEYVSTYGLVLSENCPESLQLLATALEEWRRGCDEQESVISRKATLAAGMVSTLSAINQDLKDAGIALVVMDTSSAEACIEQFARRVEKARDLRKDLRFTCHSLQADIAPKIETLNRQVGELFEIPGLEQGDEHTLKHLCDQIDAFREAQRAVESARIVVATSRDRLQPDAGDELMTRADIERETIEASELAERRDVIRDSISEIMAKIGQAQQQTQLETAIAQESAALDLLIDGRQHDYEAAAARVAFGFIQSQNREVNRPPVFRAADALFTVFTNGAYRLGLDEGDAPEFVALESASGRGLALDELSSGTRVQLLLAVRIAFIESMEQGPQLPLILDETLGNTDDTRATAIINAAIEIARRGRQVIYFTAQQDEIGKWSASLNLSQNPVAWKAFDLARIRGKAQAEAKPAHAWDRSIFESPDIPDDVDRDMLFELFNVPPVDMWSDHVQGVDLWYLVLDVTALIELRNRHIHQWGQFLNLHRGQHLKGIWSQELHDCALARALVIETVCREWQHGRAKQLTRECLRESGIVSDVFWEKVIHCAESHNWDGSALIEALERGEIKTFRRPTIDKLDEWFREQGYITNVEPWSNEMIRARVLSAAHPSIEEGVITPEEIDALLMSMQGEALLTH